jgi:hypothetical protein
LYVDIETQPDLVYTWGVYEQNAIAVKEHWQLLSYSAEWQDGKVITKGLCDYKGYKAGGDDYDLAQDVWSLLDEADIVVAHNGVDFDLKALTARFIAHGMKPPSPYKIVDTKRGLKSVSRFSSNKLDWIGQQLEIGKKIDTGGWNLWLGCMAGDKKSWAKMKKYNRHDVVLLKRLYKLLSPWIRQPNTGAWTSRPSCPNPACGSLKLTARGYARSKTRVYQRYQCSECGTWARSVSSEKGEHASTVAVGEIR